ncbi:lysophospholipid acyltransferase family protein [Streptomyces sp. MZ04]|uniref:lysophospholipid acyltransferase family protein n=1 Tax=Streptomyces sp. MZ04 TaxID=2559236 RepID=UPI00107E90BF|nr:lysophospholipid acyltransferase family protein [Streptomyces sp. MZ04]TGB15123.1 1-acyl-sn-glycerol-3-phosphate acyltransferase [Streptomyces sp. MZ04]
MSRGEKLTGVVRLLAQGRDWRGRARVPRSAEPFRNPPRRRQFATAWARTPLAGAVRHGLQRGLLKPTAWAVCDPDVEGLEHLDALRGPVVFVANHASHLDTPLVLGALPPRYARRTAVGAAADYFFDSRWRGFVTALVINGFPVERRGSTRLKSLAPELVKDGWNLLLFPEGTRSADGWMNRVQAGSAYLCCAFDIPAVPVAIRGSFAAMPRGRGWPVPGRPRVSVRFGRPLRPEPGESARAFNSRLASAIARLWNEEELGWYGALRQDEPASLAGPKGPPQAASWRRVWEAGRPLRDPGK